MNNAATTGYTFKTLPIEWRETSIWRQVDLSQLNEKELARFQLLRNGIEIYLKSGKLQLASTIAGCSKTTLLRQLNRCVTMAGDDRIFGWSGLIHYLHTGDYERHLPVPDEQWSGGSGECSGAFQRILNDHPSIREKLEALILKKSGAGRPHIHESRIRYKTLTNDFIKLCKAAGIGENQYPLNTKSKGRRSISRYANALIREEVSKGTLARYGEEAWKHLRVGTGHPKLFSHPRPMREWGTDAHKIDCVGCVIVPGPAGPQKIAISRLWFIPVHDRASNAVLGYSVGIRREISAATVEQAFVSALSQWKPRILSAGAYSHAAGFPSSLFPELVGCGPAILTVDNAVQHYASRISEGCRRRLGCAFTWGALGDWGHNAITERLFGSLERYGFQRLPSTTGSNVLDTRRTNPVSHALKHGIEWSDLLDLIDVIVAEYNGILHRGLFGQSPLSILRNHLDPAQPLILPRPLPPASLGIPELGTSVLTVTVRGSQKRGVRPYIQYQHARYRNPDLANSFDLVGLKIVIHVRAQDVSSFEAYLLDGQPLGRVVAEGRWGEVPHSEEIRKEIGQMINAAEDYLGPETDPVQALLQKYANTASREGKNKPKNISRAATKLAKIAHETGRDIPLPESQATSLVKPLPSPSRTALVSTPNWKTI